MTNETELKAHLKELEESHLMPEIRTSSEKLDRLLTDDFFEFGSSGSVIHKEDCVGEEGVEVRELSLRDFEIHPMSSKAILTTYRVRDETRKQDTLRSSIWKHIDGRWQMFFHQGTIVKSNSSGYLY
ncbi:DUF4440 domain-containing protein [Halalkalibacter sp. APA_J-10(15)]|uniref:nuclear transport factor 2 family protein n=1 Tax=Halalkalibacter sp. APA_J-10(15) TaxID=2933805 RepID=UPI001FF271C0|nr:DUF4440 domain-containing protein [Halalkalibacter sp. APA_J-10(15)]MCK0472931.1 DUF4440 domain-containing protein [Halalkalibacter sp. APA_J-10(15)]